ncbi:DUF1932 domain-containing protein [Streptomyces cyaneofuscatus]|uniref:DUF1932 domain-containing protein n=1 Tax=Streptomyces cyaneofuscatus TaxID=66883 RepID=UPI003645D69B
MHHHRLTSSTPPAPTPDRPSDGGLRCGGGFAHARADARGVGDQLTAEAEIMISAILSDPEYLPSVAARAWRWAPEMEEVADTLRAADLPTDMTEATARVLALREQEKDRYDVPVVHTLSQLRSGRSRQTGPDNKQGPGR